MFAMGFQLAESPGLPPVRESQRVSMSYEGERRFEEHFESEALRFLSLTPKVLKSALNPSRFVNSIAA